MSRGKIQVYVNKEKFVFRLIVARLKYAGPIYLTPVISTMLKTWFMSLTPPLQYLVFTKPFEWESRIDYYFPSHMHSKALEKLKCGNVFLTQFWAINNSAALQISLNFLLFRILMKVKLISYNLYNIYFGKPEYRFNWE